MLQAMKEILGLKEETPEPTEDASEPTALLSAERVSEELARTYADAHGKIVRQQLIGGERNFQEGRRSAARNVAVELGLLPQVEERAFQLYRRAK